MSAGKGGRLSSAEPFKVHAFEQGVYGGFVVLFILQLQRESDVLFDGELAQKVIFLKNETHAGVSVTVKVRCRKIVAAFAFHDDFAAVRFVQSARDVQKRRFSRTAFAEQKNHSFFGKNDRNVVERAYRNPAFRRVSFDEMFYFKHSVNSLICFILSVV